MTVGDLITMLRAYPNDDEIEIQVFETNSGELIDSTSAIGIVEEDILALLFPLILRRRNLGTTSNKSKKMSSPPNGDFLPALTTATILIPKCHAAFLP